MKKVLLPIDSSERSMKSIALVKSLYAPGSVDITIIMVREDMDDFPSEADLIDKDELTSVLNETAEQLGGFKAHQHILFGRAGEETLNFADENKMDFIFMTKSTRKGWSRIIGSVTPLYRH